MWSLDSEKQLNQNPPPTPPPLLSIREQEGLAVTRGRAEARPVAPQKHSKGVKEEEEEKLSCSPSGGRGACPVTRTLALCGEGEVTAWYPGGERGLVALGSAASS